MGSRELWEIEDGWELWEVEYCEGGSRELWEVEHCEGVVGGRAL